MQLANLICLYGIDPNLAEAEITKLTVKQINILISTLNYKAANSGLLELLCNYN